MRKERNHWGENISTGFFVNQGEREKEERRAEPPGEAGL